MAADKVSDVHQKDKKTKKISNQERVQSGNDSDDDEDDHHDGGGGEGDSGDI